MTSQLLNIRARRFRALHELLTGIDRSDPAQQRQPDNASAETEPSARDDEQPGRSDPPQRLDRRHLILTAPF